ncbi:MAG: FMN-binding protein [Muribaculaceae bacterium]|nr:FMN-binding protein [Muribaculaceae bacterium]MDE6753703.1 FMN-binding protein [Muribaculaceae bacterium]
MIKGKIGSLLCCILLMAAAALCVNKTIFGYPEKPATEEKKSPSSSVEEKGSGKFVVLTNDLCNVTGYAGKTPLEIKIVNDTIEEIVPLSNKETPSFFKRASRILESWKGKSVDEGIKLDVDAVSGATMSSQALKANVSAGLSEYDYHKPTDTPSEPLPLRIWVALGVTLIACVFPLFVRNKYYHNIQLITNVIVLGFWAGQFLDYSLMLKFMSSGISLPAGLTAIAMLIAAFIYPLFGRPQHYCNHICPLGSAQQLITNISKCRITLDPRVVNVLNWFRKILWAVLMLLLWGDTATAWMDYELFQAFMFKSASWTIIIITIVFLLLSFIVSRPYCRFVCPTGSLFKRAENMD